MRAKIEGMMLAMFLVALATTLVLPGRATPAIVDGFFNSLSNAVNALMGRSTTKGTTSG